MKVQEKKRSGYQKKSDPRAKRTILMGYGDRDSTYRVYDPDAKSVILTREVVFDENKTIDFTDGKESYDKLQEWLDVYNNEEEDDHEMVGEKSVTTDDSDITMQDALDDQGDGQLVNINYNEESPPIPPRVTSIAQEQTVPVTPMLRPRQNLRQPERYNPSDVRQGPSQSQSVQKKASAKTSTPKKKNFLDTFLRNSCAEALITYGDEPTTYHDALPTH